MTVPLDALPLPALLRRLHEEDRRVLPAVERVLPQVARAVRAAVAALRRGGRLIYVGAGTSGRIGLLDALEVPPTFGVPPETVQAVVAGGIGATVEATSPLEDDAALGRREMRRLRVGRRDVVVGIAASGSTPFTVAALAEARRRGATTVALAARPRTPLVRAAHIAIVPQTGEEAVRGSTRLKAGTAQKLVLNMLSTATMVRLGHVYGDLMVGVRPLNAKLRARARAIVAQAAGVPPRTAARLLAAAGGEVKTAIVMARLGTDAEEARRRLRRAGGSIRVALAGGAVRVALGGGAVRLALAGRPARQRDDRSVRDGEPARARLTTRARRSRRTVAGGGATPASSMASSTAPSTGGRTGRRRRTGTPAPARAARSGARRRGPDSKTPPTG